MNYRVKSIHEIKQLIYLYLIAFYCKAEQNQCDSEEISVKGAQRPNQCYKNGNRTKLVQNGDTYTYTYGERNRLESISVKKAGSATAVLFAQYQYDGNGNTIGRTVNGSLGESVNREDVFEYDTMNRLVKTTETVEGVVTVTEYFYDNAGNRFIKKSSSGTTVYLRHGQIAVALDIELYDDATDANGTINRYVLSGDLLAGRITTKYLNKTLVSTEKFWYHLDHLNSTKCVTAQDGSLNVMYEYRAFGEQLKKLGEGEAKYTYGGKELDDSTNLYYFNARYYDATIGRFINVDPVQDGTNWYVYCNNNPLSMVDPTGLKDIFMNSKQFDKMLNMYTYKSQERVSPGVNDAVGILGLVSKFSSFISSLFTPVNMANNRGVAENIGQIRLLSKLQGQYQDVLDNGGQFVLSHTQKKEMSKTDFGTMITKNYLTLDIIDADGNSVLDKKYDLSFQQKLVDSAKESKIDWDSLIKKAEDFEKKFNSRDVNDDVTIPNRSDRLKEQKSKADKETNFSY